MHIVLITSKKLFKAGYQKMFPPVETGRIITAYYYRDKKFILEMNSCSNVHAVIRKGCITLYMGLCINTSLYV